MKKTMIIIVLLSLAVFCFSEVLQLGVGADFKGEHKVKSIPAKTYEVETGYSFYAEYMLEKSYFLFGAGASYQKPRVVTSSATKEGKVGFIPVYLVGRIQAPRSFLVRPVVIAQMGYSIFTADKGYKDIDSAKDLTGGLYWGLGAGLQLHRLVIQAIYQVSSGQTKNASGVTTDISQNQLNVSVGFSY